MKASDNVFPKLIASEGAAPATPAAGTVVMYAKADGRMYQKDDAGAESALGGGLANPMTTAGDLITGGVAGSPQRLAAGTDGQVLAMASGAPAWVDGGVVKLAEVVVAAAQQDIDFPSLDLDAHGVYRIELYVIPNATGAQDVSLYYNGDTTAANYRRQSSFGVGATMVGQGDSTAKVILTNAITSTAQVFSADIHIRKRAGAYPSAKLDGQTYDATDLMDMSTTHVKPNTANVTSIKLRHSGNFGVGTFARLYRLA